MTAFEPSLRPTANDIVNEISQQQTESIIYGRVCCFEETMPSEDTSWQGSIAGNDIFETAQTLSDATTIPSKAMPTPNLPMNEPIFESHVEQIQDDATAPLESNESSVMEPTDELEEPNKLPAHLLELDVQSPPLDADERIRQWSLLRPAVTASEPKDVIMNDPTSTNDAAIAEQTPEIGDTTESNRRSSIVKNTADSENAHEIHSKVVKELEAAFLTNHQRFEERLLQLKREDSGWQSYVLTLIGKSPVDQKRNISRSTKYSWIYSITSGVNQQKSKNSAHAFVSSFEGRA